MNKRKIIRIIAILFGIAYIILLQRTNSPAWLILIATALVIILVIKTYNDELSKLNMGWKTIIFLVIALVVTYNFPSDIVFAKLSKWIWIILITLFGLLWDNERRVS